MGFKTAYIRSAVARAARTQSAPVSAAFAACFSFVPAYSATAAADPYISTIARTRLISATQSWPQCPHLYKSVVRTAHRFAARRSAGLYADPHNTQATAIPAVAEQSIFMRTTVPITSTCRDSTYITRMYFSEFRATFARAAPRFATCIVQFCLAPIV
jgi:hypothetical protein